ncbi:MAG: hypothetical protein ACRDJC_24575, partial [Thermomicrobiales bacterium]
MKNSEFAIEPLLPPGDVAAETGRREIDASADARLIALDDAAVVRSIGNTPLMRLRRLERHLALPDTIELHLKA